MHTYNSFDFELVGLQKPLSNIPTRSYGHFSPGTSKKFTLTGHFMRYAVLSPPIWTYICL